MTNDVTDGLLTDYPVVRTTDIAHAAEVLERVMPRVPLQLRVATDEAVFEMQMNAVDVGAVTTTYLRFGADTHVVNSETTFYHVNIPLTGSTVWRMPKHVVRSTPTVGVVFGPGVAGELVWSGDCAQLCLMLPQSSLDRELGRYLDREIVTPVIFAPAMSLTSSTTRGWRNALRLVVNEAERSNGRPLHPLTSRSMENLLIDSLLLAQSHNYSAELNRPAPVAAPRVVRQAIELLEARPDHPWSVAELAAGVHVSVRALQQAFARSAGTSPMRYLRQVRLSRVRGELLDSEPGDTTVTEIATRWGFTHHGHFAASYRAKFGEPPAHTLRR